MRLAFAPAPGAELGSGDDPLDAALSPDGRSVAFVATRGGVARLWIGPLDGRAAEIAATEGARYPVWKRTGTSVSYFTDTGLRHHTLNSRLPDVDLAPAMNPAGAAWLTDGSLIFAPTGAGPLRRLRNNTTDNATVLRPDERAHVFPMATDTGTAFVYVAVRKDGRRIVRLSTGERDLELGPTTGHAQLVGDVLLHVRGEALVAARFDAEAGRLAGPPALLSTPVGVSPSGHAQFVAGTRLVLAAPPGSRARQLVWVDAAGGPPTAVGGPGDFWQVRVAPDGQFVAVTVVEPLLRSLDVALIDVTGSEFAIPLTRKLTGEASPVWSSKRHILVQSGISGRSRLVSRPPYEGAPSDHTIDVELDATPTDWRGDQILLTVPGKSGTDIRVMEAPTLKIADVATTSFNESDARWSPDGRWIALVSDESGQPDIYALRWPGGARTRVSFGGGSRPRWSHDGAALYFMRGTHMMRVRLRSGTFATPEPLFDAGDVRDFDASRTSNRLLLIRPLGRPPADVTAIVDWRSLQP